MSEKPAPRDVPRNAAPARLTVEDGVAWVRLDDPEKGVNTLSTRLSDWLEETLAELEERSDLRGLVLISEKTDHFMAGADIDELEGLEESEEVYELLRGAHALLRRFERLPYPSVAAVHGACLGGGLELALVCDHFLATDHPKTKLGVPEVQLGLFPGMGGTQRLPRRIGVVDGLDLILTGKQIDAGKGERLGLVDATCAPEDLETRARELVARGKRGRRRPSLSLVKRLSHLLAHIPLLEKVVFGRARKRVLERTGGHYPAPLAAIDVVEEGLRLPLDRALDLEARTFSRLVVGEKAKKLMSIFFTKNDVEERADRLAEKADREVKRVGVLGAGFMGSGIAQLLAHRGYDVVMKDKDRESLDRGLDFCREQFESLVEKGRYTKEDAEEAMSRVAATLEYEPFSEIDFVIEAVFEEVKVKHAVLAELEEVAPQNMVFASNTSAIPIATLAEGSQRPQQVVGIHFFSPVHRMPLVEVIRHSESTEAAVAATVSVGAGMGKTVITVNDGPGFFTTRVLAPFANEAAWCLTDGARIEQIDRALTDWGWPVGAMALLDEVGLDIAHHAATVLISHLGDRLKAPPAFERMIEEGRVGRKAKRGFYLYNGEKKGVDETVYELIDWKEGKLQDREIAERCWLQMLNEAARCMEEGIIENPRDVDLGVIFGFGFPPFRGGILRQADETGLQTVVEKLEGYAERYGERFSPAGLLRDMAQRGQRFHDRE